jgi:hypothetical protein
MKRQKIFSIALVLATLIWPAGFARAAEGQPRGRGYVADTGMFKLGPGQTLRLTINGQAGGDTLNVRFRRMYYAGSANGGVWKGSVVAQDTSAPITLASDEAVSADVSQGGFDGVRLEAVIRGYTGTTHVNAGVLQIINSDGSVAAFFDIFPEVTF